MKIWLSSPHMSGNEMPFIQEAMDENLVFPLGPNVKGFEQDICEYTSIKYATCLSSGTAAIHLALQILGVEVGDEVICSSFTFAASAFPICYLGARPIFVDSEPETWNMDPDLLRRAIEDRYNCTGRLPRAIVLVHLYGMPAHFSEIAQIAGEYGIAIIEDAAEALGSSYRGKSCGTFGDIGVFSFNGNKIITTSGGGALVSENESYANRALFLATQAKENAPFYLHKEVGFNYRMSNISAGIGRGQMQVLNDRVAKRREHFFEYKAALSHSKKIRFLESPSSDFFSNHWLTTIVIEDDRFEIEDLILHLEAKNIESRRVWHPMHLQPVFRKDVAYMNGVSECIFKRGLCLPSSSNMTIDQRNHVIQSIEEFLSSIK